jgi:hypothetical protein
MTPGSGRKTWPMGSDYSAAIQNPAVAFLDFDLKNGRPILDKHGLPLLQAGNFAFVFKFQLADGQGRARDQVFPPGHGVHAKIVVEAHAASGFCFPWPCERSSPRR